MTLSDHDKRQLVELCNSLGSASGAKRSAAARAADKFVKDAGLTWYDVLGVRVIPRNAEINGKLEFLKQHPEFLTEWQSGFIISLDRFDILSAAQLSTLSETHAQAGIKQRREERQARKAATELDEALLKRERLGSPGAMRRRMAEGVGGSFGKASHERRDAHFLPHGSVASQ